MKKVIFFLTLFGIISSCSIKQSVDIVKPNINDECLVNLDSLSNFIHSMNYGLYSVDLSKFPIDEFKGLSDMELSVNEIPFKEKEQRVYQFIRFLGRLKVNKSCYSQFSKENIKRLIGKPTNVSKKGNLYEYLLKTGFECPNCNVPIERLFESCDYIRFYF
ncbi:MAG: hypothetical protein WAS72_11805, partial [Saprospiraceae bacterium]